jgi:hypothetical protein
MSIIVTYDVPSRHVELKNCLFKKGYQDYIMHPDSQGVSKKIYLPNTTVYHPSKAAKEGRDDVGSCCKGLGIELERCVATAWSEWSAEWGKPFGK